MRSKTTTRLIGGAAALALALGGIVVAQDLSQVEIEPVPAAGTVTMLMGRGGNIAVCAGEDGVFLIDDQFAELSDKIQAAVADISDEPIRFLLNTHWHGDHTGGNEALGKSNTLIVAHENVRRRLESGGFIEAFQRDVAPAPEAALPVVTFNDTVTFHVNGEEIHAFHVGPAHTDGDSIIHFRTSNVLHTGDLYFNGLYPFFDTSSGGDVEGVLAAANRMLSIVDDDTKIIPGHGPLSNKAELIAYRDLLQTVIPRIKALVKQGKTLEEIIESQPTAEFDEDWGGGFLKPAQWIGLVHESLTRDRD